MNSDFAIEYHYNPSPDAEEKLAQAWDLILSLILEELIAEKNKLESENDNDRHDSG